MLCKKSIYGEDGDLQNQFTAYLVRAVQRKRREVIHKQIRRQEMEVVTDLQEYWDSIGSRSIQPEEMADYITTSFQEMSFENVRLEHALQKISERDRYVLFAKIIEERSLEEIAVELGIGYKGLAAIYYRAIQKIRKEMENVK